MAQDPFLQNLPAAAPSPVTPVAALSAAPTSAAPAANTDPFLSGLRTQTSGGGDPFLAPLAAASSGTPDKPAQDIGDRFSAAWNEPGTGVLGHIWNVANVPLIDSGTIKNWTGWEPESGWGKGLEELATGLSSPLSLGLMLGTFGTGSLLEAGGAAALKGAGMAAPEIAEVVKGSEFIAKAIKAGRTAAEGLVAAEKAGVNPATVQAGLAKLADAGLTAQSLHSGGIAHAAASSLLRDALGVAKADKVGVGLQALMDAGFTYQQAAQAAAASPRVLDALKEGNYEEAERLGVEALGSGTFAALGAKGLLRHAGEHMDNVAAAAGLNVKPTEENLRLRQEFGIADRDKAAIGQAEKLWAEDVRKKYGVGKAIKDADLRRVLKFVEAGQDEAVLAERRGVLEQAAGRKATPAAEEAAGAEVTRKQPEAAGKQIWQMSMDELEAAEKTDRAQDDATLRELFGEAGAKRYNSLQRTANSVVDTERADRASAEIKQMESGLTAEQEKRLYGIGEKGETWEDYREMRHQLGQVYGDNPTELGQSLRWAVTKLGDVEKLREKGPQGWEQKVAAAQFQRAAEIAAEQGWDMNAVWKEALRSSAARFEPNDAAFMLQQFAKRPPKLTGTTDTDFFAQAKQELAPDKSFSDLTPEVQSRIALRAQELKSNGAQGKVTPGNGMGEVNAEAAGRAMDEARVRKLVEEQHVKQKYTPAEIDALLDSYDAAKLTPKQRALAKEINQHFSETFERASAAGALGPDAVRDYVTHLWAKDASDNAAVNRLLFEAEHNGAFRTNTSMARRRILMNAYEGELLGKKLAVSDPIALAAHNGNVFGRVVADRDTLSRLADAGTRASDGRPMVALAGTGRLIEGENGPATLVNPKSIRNVRIADKVIEGFKQNLVGDETQLDRLLKDDVITQLGKDKEGNPIYAWNTQTYRTVPHAALQDWHYAAGDSDGNPVLVKGEMRVHPEAEQYIRQRLGLEGSPLMQSGVGKAILGAGREAKGTLLAFSPFHLMQEGLRAIMTGVSPFGVERWDLRTDPVLAHGVEHGLTLGADARGIAAFQEGTMKGHSKLIAKIPGLGGMQDWLQGYLFDKYIPGLKARAYRKLVGDYREAYPDWTPNKVAETAAADVNERFGGINYARLGRSAMTQDIFRVAALAPDWLESEMRFMARTFGDEGKIARRDVARMAVGMWATARVLNLLNTGSMHNEAPFGVAVKDKDGRDKVYSLRTLPTDMLHAISDPGGFLSGRVAPLGRAAAQAYTGRDEYGRKLPSHGLIARIATTSLPIPAQTIAKQLAGEGPELSNFDQVVKAGGGQVYPYRTQAQKLAAELASDHSESGPVDQARMKQHQFLIHAEDQIRSGQMRPEELYGLVENGQLTPTEGKAAVKNLKETQGMAPDMARLWARAARLPAAELLQVWDKAGQGERAVLAKLLIRSRQNYFKKAAEMAPEERKADAVYKRFRALFPSAEPW